MSAIIRTHMPETLVHHGAPNKESERGRRAPSKCGDSSSPMGVTVLTRFQIYCSNDNGANHALPPRTPPVDNSPA